MGGVDLLYRAFEFLTRVLEAAAHVHVLKSQFCLWNLDLLVHSA